MRVIAVIDDPRVVEKILRHLGAWHDPPTRLPPAGVSGSCIYEPFQNVDPMPDNGNVLTDLKLPPFPGRLTGGVHLRTALLRPARCPAACEDTPLPCDESR